MALVLLQQLWFSCQHHSTNAPYSSAPARRTSRRILGIFKQSNTLPKTGVLEREVLSFFSDFREFKELGICNFFTSDQISVKFMEFCDKDI